jgi:hypothetical protein
VTLRSPTATAATGAEATLAFGASASFFGAAAGAEAAGAATAGFSSFLGSATFLGSAAGFGASSSGFLALLSSFTANAKRPTLGCYTFFFCPRLKEAWN